MSDLGTVAFDNSEKIDILIKENFNVPSTNENTQWYLEDKVPFNTYVNGKNILLDEIPNSVDWDNASLLSDQELSSIYGLSSSDFYTGGGVKKNSSGILHKFIKLKLQPIPGTTITSGSTTTYFSYYHIKNGVNLLENSFQLNHGDGTSFVYLLYSENNIANDVSILQDSNGGNWFFNFKNGIVFVPDPVNSSIMLDAVNQNKLPYFTFVKYVGRKGIAKQISVVQNKTTITNPENNQIAVQTTDNTIHLYDGANWVGIGGSGNSDISFNDTKPLPVPPDFEENQLFVDTSHNIIFRVEEDDNGIKSFEQISEKILSGIEDPSGNISGYYENQLYIRTVNPPELYYNYSGDWKQISGSGGGGANGGTQIDNDQILEQTSEVVSTIQQSQSLETNYIDITGSSKEYTFPVGAIKVIYRFRFNLTWDDVSNRGDTISQYELQISTNDGTNWDHLKTFRLRNSVFSENFATIEHVIEKGSYPNSIKIKLVGKSINSEFKQKIHYSYLLTTTPEVVKPILELVSLGTRTIQGAALFNKDGNNNLFYTDGNVGIGTNDPDNKLHVVGDIKSTSKVIVNDFVAFGTGSGSGNGRKGYVGRSNTSAGDDMALSAENGSLTIKSSSDEIYIESGKTSAEGIILKGNNTVTDTEKQETNVVVQFPGRYSASTETDPVYGTYPDKQILFGGIGHLPSISGAGTGTSFNLLLCPPMNENKSKGKIGIGINTNPSAQLHVGGGGKFEGTVEISSTRPEYTLKLYTETSSTEPNGQQIQFMNSESAPYPIWIEQGNSAGVGSALQFYGNAISNINNKILTLRSDGNVGIGTSNPNSKLHVWNGGISIGDTTAATAGNLNVEGSINCGPITSTGTISTSHEIRCDTVNTTSNTVSFLSNHIKINKNDIDPVSTRLVINTTTKNTLINPHGGNVGIGTLIPSKLLHIESTSASALLKITRTGYASLYFGGDYGWGNITSDKELSLKAGETTENAQTSNSPQLLLDTNGNVGIGTNNPSEKLDVYGNINTGKIYLKYDNEINSTGTGSLSDLYLNYNSDGDIFIGTNSSRTNNVFVGNTGGQAVFNVNRSQTFSKENFSGWAFWYDNEGSTGKARASQEQRDSNQLDQWIIDGGLSIYGSGSIWSGKALIVSSDKRIKENIREVDDSGALKKVRDISCVYYEYRDKLNKGYDTTIGFIAQQVREHLPLAISITKSEIPSVYKFIKDFTWETIVDVSNNTKQKLHFNDDIDISSNTYYKFYTSNDLSSNDIENNKHDLKCCEDDLKSFVFDQSWNYVFLYGEIVNDFHALDKQKLFALNFSATQEIDRIQQQQLLDISGNTLNIAKNETDIELLKLENSELKTENADLKTELATLKTQMTDVLSRLSQLESN